MYKTFRTREEMLNSGYQLDDRDSACRDCSSPVTWGSTPSGKKILLDGGNSTRVHWGNCRAAAPRTQSPASAPAPAPARSALPPPAPEPTIVRPELVRAMRELALAINELRDTIARRAPATSRQQPAKSTPPEPEWGPDEF